MARKIEEFRRQDGTLTFRVRFRHGANKQTGKPRNTSETFFDREQAQRFVDLLDLIGPAGALDQIYADEQGDSIPTLAEYADKHIGSLTRITEGTRTKYRSIFASNWAGPLGAYRLHQIDRHMISAVINAQVAAGKSDKTIANAHGLLAGIFNGAVIDRLIALSPSTGVKLPRNTDHESVEHRYLTRPEYAVLRMTMVEHFRPLLDMLIGAGIRWGEAEALRVGDIDPRAGTVSISRAAKWDGSKSVRSIGPTKTKKGRRIIRVDPFIISSVLPLLADKKRDDLVFTMPRGGQLRHSTFHSRYWTPAMRSAGFDDPRLRIHDLRHSFASWQLTAGVPIYVVQYRLGHESIQTTVDTYGHLLPDSQDGAVQIMGAAFAEIQAMSNLELTT
ncbi:MAG: site-specific integrase [Hyphomicrobiales bacterium]|nr:MAG: site-specific integrase [Hyphomicrobiales bacterium]